MLDESTREGLVSEILRQKRALENPSRVPATREQILAQAAYNPYIDKPSPGHLRTSKDYMRDLSASMDSIKEVLSFLAAQEAMEIFASNEDAASLYGRIISAGLAAIFQQNR